MINVWADGKLGEEEEEEGQAWRTEQCQLFTIASGPTSETLTTEV